MCPTTKISFFTATAYGVSFSYIASCYMWLSLGGGLPYSIHSLALLQHVSCVLNNLYPHYFSRRSHLSYTCWHWSMYTNFKIICCFQDDVQQSTWLIDIVSAFNSLTASYPFSMLYVFIAQWDSLLAWWLLIFHAEYFPILGASCSYSRYKLV